MLLAPSVSCLFKRRQFEPEVVLLAVGWYLRFSLSYRDVEELLAERGVHADHVTVWRWVQRYAPEMERRLRSTRPKWVLPALTKTGELTLILAQGTGWPAVGCSDWLDDHRIDLPEPSLTVKAEILLPFPVFHMPYFRAGVVRIKVKFHGVFVEPRTGCAF
jgi:hypothetical protein